MPAKHTKYIHMSRYISNIQYKNDILYWEWKGTTGGGGVIFGIWGVKIFGIWDLGGKIIWDLGFGENIWDLGFEVDKF